MLNPITEAACRAVRLAESLTHPLAADDHIAPDTGGEFNGLFTALENLANAIKESEPILEHGQQYIGHCEAPTSISGISGASYHELARNVAGQVCLDIRNATGLKIWEPINIDAIIEKWPDVSKIIIAKWAGTINSSEIANRARIEAELANRNLPKDKSVWSKPDMPSQWGRVFGFSGDTFIRRCKAGQIRHHKHNSKSYSVHLDDLPASMTRDTTGQK